LSPGVDTVISMRPMLAKLVAEIPPGLYYEPKWDGFRAIVERDGDALEIHSRNGKPMARYFPDLVAAFRAFLPARCVVDGEIVAIDPPTRRLDFFALQQRVHPAASRVDRLALQTPASFIAFDLLRLGDEDLLPKPFREHRAALEATFAAAPAPLHITPITSDEALARQWFERFEGAGLDGLIAKDGEHPYRPNVRAMFKVKHQRTLDCVVCGYRLHKTEPDAIGSLLLGLYNDGEGAPSWAKSFGGLLPIGATASFPMARRRELLTELRPLEIGAAEHPWHGALRNERERQPLEPGARAAVRRARARAGDRGPLRPHGRRLLPPSRHVPALAPGPRPHVVRLRPTRATGRLRRRRDPLTHGPRGRDRRRGRRGAAPRAARVDGSRAVGRGVRGRPGLSRGGPARPAAAPPRSRAATSRRANWWSRSSGTSTAAARTGSSSATAVPPIRGFQPMGFGGVTVGRFRLRIP